VHPELVATLLFPLAYLCYAAACVVYVPTLRRSPSALPPSTSRSYAAIPLGCLYQRGLLCERANRPSRVPVAMPQRRYLQESHPFQYFCMPPCHHLSRPRRQRYFIFVHALLVRSSNRTQSLTLPQTRIIVLPPHLPSKIDAPNASSRPWPTLLQTIHPPPASFSEVVQFSHLANTPAASRLHDGHGHDHGHGNPTQPLLHCRQSIASHPQQAHISLPGRSSRAHSPTTLLEHLFVSSPALCGVGLSQPCLKSPQYIPRKHGSVLLITHGHIA
jgi:hypothetical protein